MKNTYHKLLTYVDSFAMRQFHQQQIPIAVGVFEEHINTLFVSGEYPLKDGYAPFCKHMFVPNFAGCKQAFLEITRENEHLIRTEYQQRKESELPVLVRYFPRELVEHEIHEAKYLDIILYSRDQIIKESEAMNEASDYEKRPEIANCEWGIISIKPQDVMHELPMTPITVMRNALGKEEGGR